MGWTNRQKSLGGPHLVARDIPLIRYWFEMLFLVFKHQLWIAMLVLEGLIMGFKTEIFHPSMTKCDAVMPRSGLTGAYCGKTHHISMGRWVKLGTLRWWYLKNRLGWLAKRLSIGKIYAFLWVFPQTNPMILEILRSAEDFGRRVVKREGDKKQRAQVRSIWWRLKPPSHFSWMFSQKRPRCLDDFRWFICLALFRLFSTLV